MSEHKMPGVKDYLIVFGTLIALTAATVYTATNWHLGFYNIIIALVIACTKAGLVIAFFMNLKNSSRLAQTWAGVGLFFLLIMFVFGLSDFMTRWSWVHVEGW